MSKRRICIMTRRLTFTQETEGNALLVGQVDDLCEKRSALVARVNDGATHSCTYRQDPWRRKIVHEKVGSKKAQVE